MSKFTVVNSLIGQFFNFLINSLITHFFSWTAFSKNKHVSFALFFCFQYPKSVAETKIRIPFFCNSKFNLNSHSLILQYTITLVYVNLFIGQIFSSLLVEIIFLKTSTYTNTRAPYKLRGNISLKL